MTQANRFGLKRDIDAATEREVRRGSGFGCIVCGEIFCDYHHLAEFSEIFAHEPDKIVLLCKSHHGDVTGSVNGRRISDETLRKYVELPYGIRHGANNWANLTEIKAIKLGKFLLLDTSVVLRIDGLDVLSFCEVDHDFPFIGVNAVFTDSRGKSILKIENNIVKGNTDSWDFQESGNTIQINNAPRKIDLRLKFRNDGVLEVERLSMKYLDGMIEILPDGSVVSKYKDKVYSISSEARIIGGDVGFEIAAGMLRFGKSERTMFFKDASKIGKKPSGGFKRQVDQISSPVGADSAYKTDVYFEGGGRMDFEGAIAGQRLKIKDMQYSSNVTALESDGFSIGIGRSNGGPSSVKLESLVLNPTE